MPTFSVQHSYRFPRPRTSADPLVTRGQPSLDPRALVPARSQVTTSRHRVDGCDLDKHGLGTSGPILSGDPVRDIFVGGVWSGESCWNLRLRLGSSLSRTASGTHCLWNVLRFFILLHLAIYIFFPFPHM